MQRPKHMIKKIETKEKEVTWAMNVGKSRRSSGLKVAESLWINERILNQRNTINRNANEEDMI